MDRRTSPSKGLTSPTWVPLPPCQQALSLGIGCLFCPTLTLNLVLTLLNIMLICLIISHYHNSKWPILTFEMIFVVQHHRFWKLTWKRWISQNHCYIFRKNGRVLSKDTYRIFLKTKIHFPCSSSVTSAPITGTGNVGFSQQVPSYRRSGSFCCPGCHNNSLLWTRHRARYKAVYC